MKFSRILPIFLLAAAPVFAADPAPAQPPQEQPDAWTSKEACAGQYSQAMKELDRGGEVLFFLNATDLAKNMMGGIRELVETVSPAIPTSRNDLTPDKVAASIDGILKDAGFYTVTGVGYSSCPRADGKHVQKMFIAHTPGAEAPLWKMIGAPGSLKGGTYLPKDSVVAYDIAFDAKVLWGLVRGEIEKFGGEETKAGFASFLEAAKTEGGLDLDALIAATGNELLVAVQMPEAAEGEEAAPVFSLGLALRDPAAAEACIRGALAKAPPDAFTMSTVDGATVYTLAKPAALVPVPVRPAFTIRDGFFLAGSTPAALQSMLDAAKKKNGIVTTAEYQKAFAGLPEKVSGVCYVSPDFMKHYLAFIQSLSGGKDQMDATLMKPLESILQKAYGASAASVVISKPDGLLSVTASRQNTHDNLAVMPQALLVGFMSGIQKARQSAEQTACMSRLRQMAMACKLYACDNDAVLPTSLDALVKGKYLSDENMLACPTRPHKDGGRHVDYDYFGGGQLEGEVSSSTVLFADKPGNHKGFIHIVFGDTHVETIQGANTLEEAMKLRPDIKLPPGAKLPAADQPKPAAKNGN